MRAAGLWRWGSGLGDNERSYLAALREWTSDIMVGGDNAMNGPPASWAQDMTAGALAGDSSARCGASVHQCISASHQKSAKATGDQHRKRPSHGLTDSPTHVHAPCRMPMLLMADG